MLGQQSRWRILGSRWRGVHRAGFDLHAYVRSAGEWHVGLLGQCWRIQPACDTAVHRAGCGRQPWLRPEPQRHGGLCWRQYVWPIQPAPDEGEPLHRIGGRLPPQLRPHRGWPCGVLGRQHLRANQRPARPVRQGCGGCGLFPHLRSGCRWQPGLRRQQRERRIHAARRHVCRRGYGRFLQLRARQPAACPAGGSTTPVARRRRAVSSPRWTSALPVVVP